MPSIRDLVVQNFKKFESLELEFDASMNVLIGDNEAGKSSVLLAIDLVLGGSRGRVESLGLETLFCKAAVDSFLAGTKTIELLPVLFVEVYLSAGTNHDLNGRQNSKHRMADGLRMEIGPIDEYGSSIREVLADAHPNFPFEYYGIKFTTFSGAPFASFKRSLRHLSIDSSRIDSEYAVREYTRSVFSLNAEVSERHRLENLYRRGKDGFRDDHLKSLNKNLTTYKFEVKSGVRSNLESDLVITEDDIPIESRGKGRQWFIKTEFALKKHNSGVAIHALLLEEPENHLSHTNMRKLVT